MKEINNLIKFKVTASKKWKCLKCKKNLYGEEGFIDIKHYNLWKDIVDVRICWNCITSFLKDSKEDRKNRKKRFEKLVKINIVRHLK